MGSDIREDQWQAMLKLVCEVSELPLDMGIRRKRLAAGLCELVGGASAHSFETREDGRDGGIESTPDCTQLRGMRAYFKDGEHHVIATISLSDGSALGVGVRRSPTDKPFTQNDCDVLSTFHLHAWRLYGKPAKDPKADPKLDALPPRVQPVLNALLTTGDGEKQIAAHLKLSRHTVHEYVKMIYGHLGVSSRAELMNRFGSVAMHQKSAKQAMSLAS